VGAILFGKNGFGQTLLIYHETRHQYVVGISSWINSRLHILLDHESNVDLGTELLLGDHQKLSHNYVIIKVTQE
jgi:hypothetical protein